MGWGRRLEGSIWREKMEVDMIKMHYVCLWNFHKIKILINRNIVKYT